MTEDRLAGLAILFIHRDIYLCRENIMRKFDEAKKRRMDHCISDMIVDWLL
jgi:hypothetical protein